jgi:hypothetical protein
VPTGVGVSTGTVIERELEDSFTTMLCDAAVTAVAPVASETLTEKTNPPTAVGVPEMTPVAGLRVSPVGRAPLEMLHV